MDTPVSPELLPTDESGTEMTQKTEDLVGPYELHDFFLYYGIRWGFEPSKVKRLAKYAFEGDYPDEVIDKWLKTFYRRFSHSSSSAPACLTVQRSVLLPCHREGIGECRLTLWLSFGWRISTNNAR